MKKAAILLIFFAFTGCASTPDDYGDGPQATSDLAQCRAQSDAAPFMVNATSNPFGTAAMQQQYIADCMTAKGYH